MDPVTIAAGAATAVKFTKDRIGDVSEFCRFVEDCRDKGIDSLSAYTKRTMVSSRVYLEDRIAGEPTVLGLLKFLNQMYCGMVLSAMNLNELVDGCRSVRQLMAAVSTEDFHSILDMVRDEFGDKNVSVREIAGTEAKDSTGVTGAIGGKEIDIKVDASDLFTGRLMEVTLGSGPNKAQVYFIVQLIPYIIPGLVMEEFITNNVPPSKVLRKAALKAGEISFWRDYVFEMDRILKRKKALRLDKDGILREVEDRRSHNLWKSITNWFKGKDAVRARNCANTILILSKQKLDKICKERGINIKNYSQRQEILADTMSLMLVAYDPNYETVDLYLNGIQSRGEYTAQMIQSFTKKDDSVDMKQLLTLLSAGMAPKF